MKLEIRDGRLWGYGALAGDCPEIPDSEVPKPLLDEYGNPRYRWDSKRLVLDPMPPTAEQMAGKEKRNRQTWLVEHADEVLTRLEAAEAKLATLETRKP